MHIIDLRSDTVTQPTPAMRDAMRDAVVGDDVFDDDPTVKELEALCAERLGKQAALFVTSGTQANAVCVMAHTRRGEAILLGRDCHIAAHEAGSYAMLAGVSPCFAEDDAGVLRPASVAALLQDDSDVMAARTGLVCVENALSNGNVAPVENLAEIYRIAQARGVPVHLDGARIFNAGAALGVDVREMAQCADSVMFCLSKGLCAPVGSIVAGSHDFIHRAKKIRKVLGGGMRQAGVLAAAGLLAVTEMAGRVQQDHDTARTLAERLSALPGVTINRATLQTNLLFFTVDWPQAVLDALPGQLLARGIKILPPAGREFRFVTSHDVSPADCDTVAGALAALVGAAL